MRRLRPTTACPRPNPMPPGARASQAAAAARYALCRKINIFRRIHHIQFHPHARRHIAAAEFELSIHPHLGRSVGIVAFREPG